MTINEIYIGYGISINLNKLAKILEIPVEKSKKRPRDSDDSDEEFEFDDKLFNAINNYFETHQVMTTLKDISLQIIMFPHDCEEYKENQVALGYFTELNFDNPSDYHLKTLLMYDIGEEFTEMFGRDPHFMVIPTDCNCCS